MVKLKNKQKTQNKLKKEKTPHNYMSIRGSLETKMTLKKLTFKIWKKRPYVNIV